MEIPASRWYDVIPQRRSRRQFDPFRPIPANILESLSLLCREFRPFPYARAELVVGPADKVFRGIIGSYGRINGALAFIAFIGDMQSPHVQEEVGYTGEGIILEATALGLGTCWVGGFFKSAVVKKLVQLETTEKVLAVTPVGYVPENKTIAEQFMSGFARSHNRLPLSKLTDTASSFYPKWVIDSLEAARLAPSAVNRQPWRFAASSNSITVALKTGSLDLGTSQRLDCGIAMLHIEVAALYFGLKGSWQLLSPPQVARFNVKEP
jgi:hypothetical protein